MSSIIKSFSVLLVFSACPAYSQGLLALQNGLEKKAEQPITYSATLGGGYDNLNYKQSDLGDIDSLFIQGGAGFTFTDNDRTTPWNVGLDLGTSYYLDAPPGVNDVNYSAKAVFNIAHEFSKRLRVSNNFFLTYEVEPNFGIGSSTALRNGQYFYGYNNFSVAYAWSDRFSTTSSYTLDGIKYDDNQIGRFEDRLTHLFAEQFSYAVSKTLKAVGEYRYKTTRYDQAEGSNYVSHYLLAGVDKAWSQRSSASFRAGAEFYDSERSQKTAPYFEAALSHAASEKTTLQVFTSVGFEGAELGGFDSRYSYRLGASATHQASERLRLNAGLNYDHSEFKGGAGAADVSEDQVNASAGIGYKIMSNVSLDANYSYTILTSDDEFRDYDRNRIYLGVNASF